MGKYFGTDGFRGEANKNLTFEHAIAIGRFLGWYYGVNQGKRRKLSSEKIHAAPPICLSMPFAQA